LLRLGSALSSRAALLERGLITAGATEAANGRLFSRPTLAERGKGGPASLRLGSTLSSRAALLNRGLIADGKDSALRQYNLLPTIYYSIGRNADHFSRASSREKLRNLFLTEVGLCFMALEQDQPIFKEGHNVEKSAEIQYYPGGWEGDADAFLFQEQSMF
jgi:hypothetical protein